MERKTGTPQASAVSPILANLFMHYAFDRRMARNHPDCPFERYADGVVHCVNRRQTEIVLADIAKRMAWRASCLQPSRTWRTRSQSAGVLCVLTDPAQPPSCQSGSPLPDI